MLINTQKTSDKHRPAAMHGGASPSHPLHNAHQCALVLVLTLTACTQSLLALGHEGPPASPNHATEDVCTTPMFFGAAHSFTAAEPPPAEEERSTHSLVRLLSNPALLADFMGSVSVVSVSDCDQFEEWIKGIIAGRHPDHASMLCNGVLLTTPFLITRGAVSATTLPDEGKPMSIFSFVYAPRDGEAGRGFHGTQRLSGTHSPVKRVLGSSPEWFASGSPGIRFPDTMTDERAREIIEIFIAGEIAANDMLLEEAVGHILHSDRFIEWLSRLDDTRLSLAIPKLLELGDRSFLERFGPGLYSGDHDLEIDSWRSLASLHYLWMLSSVASCGWGDIVTFADHTLIAKACGFTLFLSQSGECFADQAGDDPERRTRLQYVGCIIPSSAQFLETEQPAIGFTLIVHESRPPAPRPEFEHGDVLEKYLPVFDAFANHFLMLWVSE